MQTGRVKTIVAVVVAIAGIGAAAWSVVSLQRRPTPPRNADGPRSGRPAGPSDRDQPHGGDAPTSDLPPAAEQRVVRDTNDGPGVPIDPVPEGPFDFRPVASDAEFADAGDVIQARVTEAARGFAWLDLARGDHKTAASAARLALAAPARGREAFDAAVTELKGDAAAGAAEAEIIVSLLRNAEIDVSHLKIKEVAEIGEGRRGTPPRPSGEAGAPARVPMMMRVERRGEGPDDEETTVGIAVQALFPETADEVQEGQQAIEVKCPARLPGVDVADGRAEIGVVLVRERGSNVWQPVMYNLYSRDRAAATAKAKAVRAERETQ